MGSLISPAITSDSGFPPEKWVTEPYGNEVWRNREYSSNKAINLQDYVNRLQEEMKKIEAFKRELPLCMLLLKDAIERLNQELSRMKKPKTEPLLEQFLPLKKKGEEEDEEYEDVIENDNKEKMNWMSSVQLWNSGTQIHQSNTENYDKNDLIRSNRPSPAVDLFSICEKRNENRALAPYKGKDETDDKVPLLSLCTIETKDLKDEMINSSGLSSKSSSSRSMASSGTDPKVILKTPQTSKKQRRCWSPELHRQFVEVLQRLGGAQVATPKQIRELMKIDGLTNDEVKSHLQKYRLHARRASRTNNNSMIFDCTAAAKYKEQCCETSKKSNTHTISPTGSLQLNRSLMEDDDEDDDDVSEINNQ